MKIKEWAEEDRPREKMLAKGTGALSDAELLAILIGSGNTRETAVQLAQRILHSAGNNLHALGKLSIRDLTDGFKGIGQAKAVTIAAALELGKRRGNSEAPQPKSIRSSKEAFQIFYPLLCDLRHEELWAVFTNRASKVIAKMRISQGGTSHTQADFQLILKEAIQSLAAGIVLGHNHPSGSLLPSGEDDRLTARLQKAAGLVNVSLLDHLIVADNRYYSYADEGKLGAVPNNQVHV